MITRDPNQAAELIHHGPVASVFLWVKTDGTKLTLAQAAELCDSSYEYMHRLYKRARTKGLDIIDYKGKGLSLVPVDPIEDEPEQIKIVLPSMTPSGRPLLLRSGYATHRLG